MLIDYNNRSMRFLLLTALIALAACNYAQPANKKSGKTSDEETNVAFRYYGMGEYDKAISELQKVLRKNLKNPDAWDMLAACYEIKDKLPLAIGSYYKVIDIEPSMVEAWFRLGKAYHYNSQYDSAKICLDHYLTLPNTRELTKKDAKELLKTVAFALNASKSPVPFNPINLGDGVNTVHNEYFPGLTIDQQTLIFTRKIGYNEDFYTSVKKDNKWSLAVNIGPPINTELNEGTVSITADGNYIFYTACNRVNDPSAQGSCDLYVSRLNNGRWTQPFNLGPPINTQLWESQPSVSADGSEIFFASARPGGQGGHDIWMSKFDTETGKFTAPVNLGPGVNSPGDEQSPFIHADGKTLYFSSKGKQGFGGQDLFLSRRLPDGTFSEAVNLGHPINTPRDEFGMIVDRSGKMAYYAADRKDSKGGLDIYMFELSETLKADPVSFVKGVVFDDETKAKLKANVDLIDLATGKKIFTVTSDATTGEFTVVLQSNKDYMLTVDQENYLFYSANFSLTQTTAEKPYYIEIPLKKPKVGETVVLRNIFYETAKYALLDPSKSELDKLVDFMKKYPKISIEIGGHTDNVGSKTSNQVLSENRAKTVRDYLVSKGISPDRITYKGYGDTKPIDSNDTPEGRASNRRTEFKITGN